eukprot:GHVT01092027.1.p1 GENE.GHVT01092027.1~~GHVT01092027.1.p1  ORF type:complete len:109 (-),score=7.91 GHVT01092027.1:46-372(-)
MKVMAHATFEPKLSHQISRLAISTYKEFISILFALCKVCIVALLEIILLGQSHTNQQSKGNAKTKAPSSPVEVVDWRRRARGGKENRRNFGTAKDPKNRQESRAHVKC